MDVIIVGAGQVGESIAANLQHEHDVTLIEQDPDRAERLQGSHDILVLEGDGTELSVLEEAGVPSGDILLASTDSDESNIVACSTAKAISDVFTVSRVKDSKYLEPWRRRSGTFGIDHMVCSDLLTAQEIVGIVGLPAAHDIETFADGLVLMAEFDIYEDSNVAGQTVEEADRFDALTFAAVIHGDRVEIPRGDTTIPPGSRVVVIGSPKSVQTFAAGLAKNGVSAGTGDVVIVGGTGIGYHVARILGDRGFSPRLIAEDPDRARRLAEQLPNTRVMHSDATDVGFLQAEDIHEADILIATFASEEANLFECILARDLGIDRTLAVIDESTFAHLFEAVGVDVAISPRDMVAEELVRFTHGWKTEKIALVGPDLAEVVEVEVDDDSILANTTIQEGLADLTHDIVIGAITRNGEFVVPRGDTNIQPGDHVVMFVESEAVDEAIAGI